MATNQSALSLPVDGPDIVEYFNHFSEAIEWLELGDAYLQDFVSKMLETASSIGLGGKKACYNMADDINRISDYIEKVDTIGLVRISYLILLTVPTPVFGGERALAYFVNRLSLATRFFLQNQSHIVSTPHKLKLFGDHVKHTLALIIANIVDEEKDNLVMQLESIPDDGNLSSMSPEDIDNLVNIAKFNLHWHKDVIEDHKLLVSLGSWYNKISAFLDIMFQRNIIIADLSNEEGHQRKDSKEWIGLNVLQFAICAFLTNVLSHEIVPFDWKPATPNATFDAMAWCRSTLSSVTWADNEGAASDTKSHLDFVGLSRAIESSLQQKLQSHVQAFKRHLLKLLSLLDATPESSSLVNLLSPMPFNTIRDLIQDTWYPLFKPIANECNLAASMHRCALDYMKQIDEGRHGDEDGIRNIVGLQQIINANPPDVVKLVMSISNKFPSQLKPIKLPSVISQWYKRASEDSKSIWRLPYSVDDSRSDIERKAAIIRQSSNGGYEAYVGALSTLQECIRESVRAHICLQDTRAKTIAAQVARVQGEKYAIGEIQEPAVFIQTLISDITGLTSSLGSVSAVESARTAYLMQHVITSSSFVQDAAEMMVGGLTRKGEVKTILKQASILQKKDEGHCPSLASLTKVSDKNPLLLSDDEFDDDDEGGGSSQFRNQF